MKTSIRFTRTPLVLMACIVSALFISSSVPASLPWAVSSAHAQSLDRQLAKLRTQIHQLIKKRTYSPALAKVKRYVMLTARKYGNRHERYAKALLLQAKVYRHLKRHREAQLYEIRAASIRKNNRKFKAKQKSGINKRLAQTNKNKAKIRTQMLLRRHQKYLQQKRAAKQKPMKKMRKKTASAPRPAIIPRREIRTARRKAAPRRETRAARPKPAPRITMRTTSRPKRYNPKPVPPPGAAVRMRGISKSIAPAPAPAPVMAPPVRVTSPPDQTAGSSQPEARMERMKPSEPAADTARANKKENHTIVRVYYATDRQRTASVELASFFAGKPSDPKKISYGICEVSIPKGHIPGQLEAPSFWRFEFKENPDKHVVLLKVFPQQKNSYFRNLKDIIGRSKGENAFIFIHGYNVTFKDAARRTAQISHDLGFDGAPVFYSWPSTGELSGYPNDEDNILWAQENIKQFLKDFVEKTDAKNIYLIAHSMGSRALTGAISSLIGEAPQFKKRFKEIILAAPDISSRVFKDNIAPRMIQASNNVTLYVSSDDKALLASRKFHANPRAGEAGENMIILNGIDTIDATGVDASLLAHSYFAEAKSIISDIVSIFRGHRPPKRDTLKQIKTQRGNYWTFATK